MSDNTTDDMNWTSEYWVERLALGEVSGEERRRIEETFAESDEELETRLAELRESNEDILEKYAPEMMAARLDARLDERRRAKAREEKRSSGAGWVGGLGVLAAAAVAAFFVLNLPGEDPSGPAIEQTETVRLKGAEPKLVVWRKSVAEPERLTRGATAAAGDVLQLEYNAAGATHGVIASVDGRGAVTLHYPAVASGSTEIDKGVVALDFSYQLDDAPKFERFFFVTSDQQLDAAQVLDSLEALAAGDSPRTAVPTLAEHTQYTDFTVEKAQ